MDLKVKMNDVKDVLPGDYQKVIAIGRNGVMQSAQYIKGLFECDDSEMYGTVGKQEVTDAITFEVLYWVAQDDFSLENLIRMKEARLKKQLIWDRVCIAVMFISMVFTVTLEYLSWAQMGAYCIMVCAFTADTALCCINKAEKKRGRKMAKRVEKYVKEGVFKMTNEEISELCSSAICVLYGYDNYDHSVAHVLELKEEVLKEYPDMKDSDMEVWFITHTESNRHARQTMLCVRIPVEDFFKLRADNKIGIL